METAIMVRDTVHLTFHSSAPFGNTRAGYSKRGDASRTRQWPIGSIQGEGTETKSLISAAKERTWFQISSGNTGNIYRMSLCVCVAFTGLLIIVGPTCSGAKTADDGQELCSRFGLVGPNVSHANLTDCISHFNAPVRSIRNLQVKVAILFTIENICVSGYFCEHLHPPTWGSQELTIRPCNQIQCIYCDNA